MKFRTNHISSGGIKIGQFRMVKYINSFGDISFNGKVKIIKKYSGGIDAWHVEIISGANERFKRGKMDAFMLECFNK